MERCAVLRRFSSSFSVLSPLLAVIVIDSLARGWFYMVGTKPTGMVRKLSSVSKDAFITDVVNNINTIPTYEGCSCRLSGDSSRCAEQGPGHHGSRSSVYGKAQGTFLLKDHDGNCLIKIAGGAT